MTPHCGVNYGSIFRRRFLCFLSARSSLCNALICEKSTEYGAFSYFGGNNRARTCDILLVRQALSQLSYAPTFGDPTEVRTRVTAVKGRCLNHLTIGPYVKVTVYFFGSGGQIRTNDLPGMNRPL